MMRLELCPARQAARAFLQVPQASAVHRASAAPQNCWAQPHYSRRERGPRDPGPLRWTVVRTSLEWAQASEMARLQAFLLPIHQSRAKWPSQESARLVVRQQQMSPRLPCLRLMQEPCRSPPAETPYWLPCV